MPHQPPTLQAVHPVLGSRDVARSIRFFRALGFEPTFQDAPDSPRYACIRRDAVELHLQWVRPEDWSPTGDHPVYRFLVREVDDLHREVSAHAEVNDITAVFESAWGTREFHLRDPDLNGLQFYWPR